MAYQTAPFQSDFSYSFAAVDKIPSDTEHRALPLLQL